MNKTELRALKSDYQLRYTEYLRAKECASFGICNYTEKDVEAQKYLLYGFRHALDSLLGAGRKNNTGEKIWREWEEEINNKHRKIDEQDAKEWFYRQSLPIGERVKIKWPSQR